MEDHSNFLIDSEAVAAILMVSKRTLQNYRSENKLKYYKLSRKTIRYRIGDVVDFVKQSSCCSFQKDRLPALLKKYCVPLRELK
jgi:hypothetical protein